jgi:hypothetical protein
VRRRYARLRRVRAVSDVILFMRGSGKKAIATMVDNRLASLGIVVVGDLCDWQNSTSGQQSQGRDLRLVLYVRRGAMAFYKYLYVELIELYLLPIARSSYH